MRKFESILRELLEVYVPSPTNEYNVARYGLGDGGAWFNGYRSAYSGTSHASDNGDEGDANDSDDGGAPL